MAALELLAGGEFVLAVDRDNPVKIMTNLRQKQSTRVPCLFYNNIFAENLSRIFPRSPIFNLNFTLRLLAFLRLGFVAGHPELSRGTNQARDSPPTENLTRRYVSLLQRGLLILLFYLFQIAGEFYLFGGGDRYEAAVG